MCIIIEVGGSSLNLQHLLRDIHSAVRTNESARVATLVITISIICRDMSSRALDSNVKLDRTEEAILFCYYFVLRFFHFLSVSGNKIATC